MGYIYTKSGKLAKRLYFGAVLLFEGLYYTFKNRVLADGGTFVENELPTISQDAKLVLTPNAYKAGKLYSAVPNDGTGDFTVDRNSTATYIDEDGLIKTALANVPRIDWSTGEAALLVEPQRTNLVTYSEDFSDNYWEKDGITLVSGQSLPSVDNPNGAFKLVEDNLNNKHRVYSSIFSVTDTEYYNASVYAKKGERDFIQVLFGNQGFGSIHCNFDLLNGEIGIPDNCTAKIELMSSGYYKCSITSKATATTSSGILLLVNITSLTSVRQELYQGDGTSGIYIFGAQVETGTKATSYIPTNGTTVTRLADNISVPTPAGVTAITETIDGVEQAPITTIPTTYSLPVGNINKVKML